MRLSSNVLVELTTSAPETLLNIASKQGIIFAAIEYMDPLHIRVLVSAKFLAELNKIVQCRGDEMKLVKRSGIQYTVGKVLHRPVLLLGALIWLLLLLYLPSRIFFIEVVGNNKISTQEIINYAEIHGIHFGASRRNVRSEKVKNALLGAMPQLQWVGVNTYGCRAVISVVERTDPKRDSTPTQLRSVIASCDAIITSVTVVKGNGLCRVGQAVRAGQLLVSPYTDCGLSVKAETAEAEILGQTNRKFTAMTPLKISKRRNVDGKKTLFGLRIGNKIINFCKDSGILDTTCAKMYEEKVLYLPGGFALPIAVVRQTVVYAQNEEAILPEASVSEWVQTALLDYLRQQMISGKIQQSMHISELNDHCYALLGNYVCEELIGQYRTEEMLPNYG